MRKIKFFLLGIIFFSISSILLLQIDDDLDPIAQNMYEQVVAHNESDAYIYLLGMQAAVDEDPMVVGKALMSAIRQAEKAYLEDPHSKQDFKSAKYPQNKQLPLHKIDGCKGIDTGCNYIDTLLSYSLNFDALPISQRVLLKRYRKLIKMKDFHSLPLPLLETPIPPFKYIINGNSLASLEALAEASSGNIKTAKTLLLEELSLLRLQLSQADTLIAKMVYAKVISRSLDVLSVMNNKYPSFTKDRMIISQWTNDEKSLVTGISREYAAIHTLYKAMDKTPSLHTRPTNLPKWVYRMLYKPNMSLNVLYPIFLQAANNSTLTAKKFGLMAISNQPIIKKESYIRNYIGTKLNQVGSADFNKYVARIFNLDAKINIYNKISSTKKLPETVTHIKNPFYESKTAYYSDDRKSVCIDVPLSTDRKEYRCLRVQ